MAAPSTLPVEEFAKDAFVEWCTAQLHVTLHDGIDLFHPFREGYRGVVAKRDLPANADLLTISRQCCIGPATTDASAAEWSAAMSKEWLSCGVGVEAAAAREAAGHAAAPPEEHRPRLTKACVTVLRLLHELGKGPSSSSAPFLAILPMDHRIPIEWTADELALLDGTAAEPLVRMGSLESQYSVFEEIRSRHPGLWHTSICTKKAFAKAVNWVRSRGFTVYGEAIMIPCADMFNHDPVRQGVEFLARGDDHFVMRTVRPIQTGEEIFSSFGHLSNASLVNSYGFVLQDNPFDTVFLSIDAVTNACRSIFEAEEGGNQETWEGRLQLLENHVTEPTFVISKYDLVPESVLECIQLLLMTDDELMIYAALLLACENRLEGYAPILSLSVKKSKEIGQDALAVAKALALEETKIFRDLKAQLRAECLNCGGDDENEEDEEKGAAVGESDDDSDPGTRPLKKRHTGGGDDEGVL
jgi:hypothetical protein